MKNFPDDFKRRVFANAFTGVNVSSYSRSLVSYAKKVSKLLTNCYFFGSFKTAIVKESIGSVDPSLVISSLHTIIIRWKLIQTFFCRNAVEVSVA